MRRRDGAVPAILALLLLAGPASAQDPMPAGHPPVDDGADPHARAGAQEAMPGVFQAPEDTEVPDPSLPQGTIVVSLRDADDKPLRGESITLGALTNSIAKGDSRKHFQGTTDAAGNAVFSGLDTASNVAYRVSSGYQGGAFAATPFQMKQAGAMRVVLHVYPVVRDIRDARVVCEVVLAAEMRDERIHVEEAFTIYNLGRSAWAPLGLPVALPEGYTAFSGQASMSDQGVDDGLGSAKLRGTFPPGKHTVDFQWQLPWDGEKDVDFSVGLPPHAAILRVMMAQAGDARLVPEGFPPAEVRRDQQGQAFLVTQRQLRPDDSPLTAISVGIHDLPTPGPGRLIATALSAGAVLLGLALLTRRRQPAHGAKDDVEREQEALLEELADLEQAHARGDAGPQTYQTTRKSIIEGLARTLIERGA
ncbi:MAG: hypothetical protein ACRENE_02660 [Polyangiaceae bacterium]